VISPKGTIAGSVVLRKHAVDCSQDGPFEFQQRAEAYAPLARACTREDKGFDGLFAWFHCFGFLVLAYLHCVHELVPMVFEIVEWEAPKLASRH
jgi:hypothetical protein